ncbi:unnamed protein product [Linum tenue]|uniref:Uncharacterized protein n=1 Tax=Linum tenue TaxID=586396 RepID=A0AAV0R1I9_9ROSI|nr:unnamed protein product [Linum tenue]
MMSGNYHHIDNQKVSGSVPAVTDPGHIPVQFAESNLQTFPPSGAQGKISGASRPPRDADGKSLLKFCLSRDSELQVWFT